jgi:hypothetical protein
MTQTHAAPIDFGDLGASTLPWSRSYRLASKAIGQVFLIEIAWPPISPKPDQPLPVIYVLGWNHSFGMAAMAARGLRSGPFPLSGRRDAGPGRGVRRLARHARLIALA